MSDSRAIRDVDDTLKALIWSALRHDAEIATLLQDTVNGEPRISFDPPHRLYKDDDPQKSHLSVFLYRVEENADMKNRPLERRSDTLLRYPPLALNLFYLLTPISSSGADEHRMLGRVMQALHDQARVHGDSLMGGLKDSAEELRIILSPTSVEDMAKLWSAFMRPYRLSACYEVKVVLLDSEREQGTELVRRKRMEVAQVEPAA